jgi:hypothetical protein
MAASFTKSSYIQTKSESYINNKRQHLALAFKFQFQTGEDEEEVEVVR